LSTLYIRLPSKAAADSASHVIDLSCHFAIAANNDVIEREGVSLLSHLVDPITQAQRVVLLLAASDVNLLHVKVPPMNGARLKAALPNLIEDQLISDPAECVIVAGQPSDGLRMVAVVNRVWLDLLIKVLLELGARQVVAVPAQLCLPYESDSVTAAVGELNDDIDVTIRFSEEDGMGLAIVPDKHDTIVRDVVQTLSSVVPQMPVSLYVQPSNVSAYQTALSDSPLADRTTVLPDAWTHWVDGAKKSSINLMAGLGMAAGPGINWAQWRWPLRIAAAVIVINLLGLNIEWWRLKHEASSLRSGMTQAFKQAYPKEPVTANPIAQMRGKIAQAQHQAGQSAPDDFTALAAGFGEAWASVLQGSKTPGIAALEYVDRSLLVRLKSDGTVPTAQIKTALASRNLSMTEQKAGEWLIRSAK
jgi:general secretion pathway protein L